MKFDLTQALQEWRSKLRRHPGIEPGYAEELESHLLDRMDDLVAEGMGEEEAFKVSVAKTLADVEEIADEFFKVRALTYKQPYWKRRGSLLDALPSHLFFTYFKQAIRSFRATKAYFWVNLLGLTLGIAATLVLVKYVSFELSTDSMHHNLDRMAVATVRMTPLSQPELGEPSLFSNLDYSVYPYVKAATKLEYYRSPLRVNRKNFSARVVVGDSAFFEVFDFFIKGSPGRTILEDPTCILLTEEMAQRLFGSTNPIGKRVEFEGEAYFVKGILAPSSQQSSLQFDAIASAYTKNFWSRNGVEVVVFSAPEDIDRFNNSVADSMQSHPQFTESTLAYLPFKDLYYDKRILKEQIFKSGNRGAERILLIIAGLIFFISIFNYVNLYMVGLLKRGKSLGVRKVLGAGRGEIAINILMENGLIASLVIVLAAASIFLSSGALLQFTGKPIRVDRVWDPYLFLVTWLALIGLTSIYPIRYFPRVNPIKAIKNKAFGRSSLVGRKMLMTTQFVITIGLIIVSIFFAKQLHFMLNRELGFDAHNVVKVDLFPNSIPIPRYSSSKGDEEAMKEATRKFRELKQQRERDVLYVSGEIDRNPHLLYPSFRSSPIEPFEIEWKHKGPGYDYFTTPSIATTPNFTQLFDIELVEGRFFDPQIDKSREDKVVINQQAKKFFGLESLEDAYLSNRSWGEDDEPFKVIGVVEDFAFEHLSLGVRPLVILFWDDRETHTLVRLADGYEQAGLASLEQLFKEINAEDDFHYSFVDEEVKAQYTEDRKVVQVYGAFTLVALLISALGLLGISSYDIQLRVKEIGIRKINGASVRQIIQLLTTDFFRYLGIAVLVACPLAAFAVAIYLEGFAHRTTLSPWVFFMAILFTFLTASMTLWTHAYRAARRNPVEALRYE